MLESLDHEFQFKAENVQAVITVINELNTLDSSHKMIKPEVMIFGDTTYDEDGVQYDALDDGDSDGVVIWVMN